MSYAGSAWTPVLDKPGFFVANGCECEVIPYACASCGDIRLTYHAVCGCDDHGVASDEDRATHAICLCGALLDRVPVESGKVQWPVSR